MNMNQIFTYASYLCKKGVFVNVDLSNLDYQEFDKYMCKEDVFEEGDTLRAPFKNFTFDFAATPFVVDKDLIIIGAEVIRADEVRRKLPEEDGKRWEGEPLHLSYLLTIWCGVEGNIQPIHTVVEPGVGSKLRTIDFSYKSEGVDSNIDLLIVHGSLLLHYICKKMSVASRWWGDTAKALSKAKIGKGGKKKKKNGGYIGTLDVFLPRKKPNPKNKELREKGSYQRTMEEILVRGGFARTYWVLPTSIERLKTKWEGEGRECCFFPDEPNTKGKVPMILIMESYKINPSDKHVRHVKNIR